jgi:cysteine-rich repeat protein
VLRAGPCVQRRALVDGRTETVTRTYTGDGVVLEVVDANGDGAADRRTQFEYGATGELTLMLTDVDADGISDERTEHAYVNGRLESRTRVRTRDGRALDRTTLVYDGQGRLSAEALDDGADGQTDRTLRLVYGPTGRVEQEELLNAAAALTERCTISSGASLQLLRRVCVDTAGRPTRSLQQFFDAAGNLTGQLFTLPSGSVVVSMDYACWSGGTSSSSSSSSSASGVGASSLAGASSADTPSSVGGASSEAGTSSSSGVTGPDCNAVAEDADATWEAPLVLPPECAVATVTGVLASPVDEDVVVLDLAAGEEVALETSEPSGLCGALDTLLEVRPWPGVAPTGALCAGSSALACDDDGALGACSATRHLATLAGTYAVRIITPGRAFPGGAYRLRLVTRTPRCGDGVVDTLEQCDDGGTAVNDGCNATCRLEGDTCATAAVLLLSEGPPRVLNGLTTVGLANTNTVGSTPMGVCNSGVGTAPDAVFELRPQTAGALTVRVQGGLGMDPVIGLRGNACVTSGVVPANNGAVCADATAAGDVETVRLGVTAGEPYWLYVDGKAGSSGPYTLEAVLEPVGCGNGVVEPGETCDDRNTRSNDGCSATCQDECVVASPPDSTWAAPLVVPSYCTRFTVTGAAIVPATDADYYRVTIPAGRQLTAETFTTAVGSCSTGDTVATVHGVSGSEPTGGTCSEVAGELVCDDDSGVGSCSRVTLTRPATTDVIVRVVEFSEDAVINVYGVQLLVQ